MRHMKSICTFAFIVFALVRCGGEGSSFSLLADSDTFVQSASEVNSKVDILWIVDNSGSMATSQQNLATNFNSFIQDFQTKNLDFKMAITGTDAWLDRFYNSPNCTQFRDGPMRTNYSNGRCVEEGTHNGIRTLTPSTPNLAAVFNNNIKQGINATGDERPFMSMTDVLDDPVNANFLRDTSYFAVIILTDEDDTSHPTANYLSHGNANLYPVADYVSYLDALTGTSGATRRYSVNTIAVQNQACLNQIGGNGQVIGNRVNSIADLTGGLRANICGNFANELSNIADNILSLATQFFLTRIPKPETIVVKVNGVVIPNKDNNPGPETGGWEYVSESNSIKFSGDYIPQAGSTIQVDFDPVAYGS